MLTFTATGGPGLRCTGADKPLTAFDPKAAQSGDIVLLPLPQENPPATTISWPGEYDIAGITIRGIGQAEGKIVSFITVIDGYRCAFLASPLQDWTDPELEQLGDVHVLAMPAENAKLAQKLLEEIDPRVLILCPGSQGGIDNDVLKSCGALGKEFVAEHKVKGLPAEGREVVILSK